MKKKKGILTVVLQCLLIVLALGLFSSLVQNHLVSEELQVLNEGWTVRINEKQYENVDLSDFYFNVLSRGDVLTMTTTLPEFEEGKCLTMKNNRAWLEVFLGDDTEPVFSFGREHYEAGRMIASGYMWVPLPESASGQKVTVVYHNLRNKSFSSVWVPRLGDSLSVVWDSYGSSAVQIWLCLFFVLLGILMQAAALPFCYKYKELRRFLYIGAFCVLTGVWVLAYDYALDIFIRNYMANTYIEYICFYLIPVPLHLFFREVVGEKGKKRFFGGMAVGTFVFAIAALVLQLTNAMAFWDSLSWFHLLIVVELCADVFLLFRNFKDKELEHQYLLAGFLVVLVTALWDVCIYRIQRFFGIGDKMMSSWNMAYGVMVMILCMIASSLIYLFTRINLKNTEELLERLAYEDSLTGLYNRARITVFADEIEQTGERDFAVISMDLNSLKYYNDTMGHAYGDQYLVQFSTLLREFWKDLGIVGRMGGDEFIVILRRTRREKVEQKIQEFERVLARENEKNTELKMDTAYGTAYGEEYPGETIREVYRHADERMYEMKRRMKKERCSSQLQMPLQS